MPTKEELIDLHHKQGFGITKIASFYPDVGTGTIRKLMKEYNIDILPPETLRKMWWKDQNHKKRMSDIRVGLWQDEEYYKKTSAHLFDKKMIEERAKKLSAKFQGITYDEWNGFLTSERFRARNSKEYSEWRNAVFERDNYQCQCCGDKSKKGHPVILQAHHLENFANNVDLRYDINNGITLCYNCHDIRAKGSFHNVYGVKNISRKQFEEYMKNRNNS